MTLNNNNGLAKFFENKNNNTQVSLCKNHFKPGIINNDNGVVVIRNYFVRCKQKQQKYFFLKT